MRTLPRTPVSAGLRPANPIVLRSRLVIGVLLLLGFVIVYRLFGIQVLSFGTYRALAEGQRDVIAELLPQRGQILVADKADPDKLYPLATNKEVFQVYGVPREMTSRHADVRAITNMLASVLPVDPDEVYSKLTKDPTDPYEPLYATADKGQADKIRDAHLAGIGLSPTTVRTYPEHELAAHILGYMGYRANGSFGPVGGLEMTKEEVLAGKKGALHAENDVRGQWIPVGDRLLTPATDGADVVLTIDRALQFQAEAALKKQVEHFEAESGSVFVMDPTTGALLAMANYPTFDPGNYRDVKSTNAFANTAVNALYEPGSIFKPLVVAMAIDSGRFTLEDKFEDKGVYYVGSTPITNAQDKSYGEQNMTQILERSSNIGMVQVAQGLGRETFQKYIDAYQLSEPTGIDMVGEVHRKIDPTDKWYDTDLATAGFGQGKILITPIRFLASVSALANDGKMVQPHVVKEVRYPDGRVEKTSTKILGQPISAKTAQTVTTMLISSVDNGVAHRAHMQGYAVAGKTGTGQVADNGVYNPDLRNTSFFGYLPDEDRKLLVYVVVRKPKGYNVWGENVAIPVFQDIMNFAVSYYQMPAHTTP